MPYCFLKDMPHYEGPVFDAAFQEIEINFWKSTSPPKESIPKAICNDCHETMHKFGITGPTK